jgi:hypothetical protein
MYRDSSEHSDGKQLRSPTGLGTFSTAFFVHRQALLNPAPNYERAIQAGKDARYL